MSVRQIVKSQYQKRVNEAAKSVRDITVPKEGWSRTVRKALGMSGAQLGRRMGISRAAISNTEKAEPAGGVTLKNMQQLAEAMGCRFVYAIVPEGNIEDVIEQQARKKAAKFVNKTNKNMALEAQGLSNEQVEYELERLKQQFIKESPSDLWND
ncbi:MAG TPA: mobile mystery protein A [Pseudomonadales bacterium]